MTRKTKNSLFKGFTHRERWGSLLVVALAAVALLLPRVLRWNAGPIKESNLQLADLPSGNEAESELPDAYGNSGKGKIRKIHLKYAKLEELLQIGFSNETAAKIISDYKQGKRLQDVSELAKLTQLSETVLLEHISPKSFKNFYKDAANKAQIEKEEDVEFNQAEKRVAKYERVDLNVCDTAALTALPGIGSKTALRLINFRNKLGGFYSFSQIKETYGIDTNTMNKLSGYLLIDPTKIRKININSVTEKELATHPYCKGYQAKAVLNYIAQHGKLTAESFGNLKVFTPSELTKLRNYVSF